LDSLLDEMGLEEEIKYDKSKTGTAKNNDNNKSNTQSKTGKCFQVLLSNEVNICCKNECFKGQTICDKLR